MSSSLKVVEPSLAGDPQLDEQLIAVVAARGDPSENVGEPTIARLKFLDLPRRILSTVNA